MVKIAIFCINFYQKLPLNSHYSCMFVPTCSEYTKEAMVRYGFFKGFLKGLYRIVRCHPWQKNHFDPLR